MITIKKVVKISHILEIEGIVIELSDWANWVAADEDGSIWEYEREPELEFNWHHWGSGGKSDRIYSLNCKQVDFEKMIYKLEKTENNH